ncbi:MAG: FmdE family protein [Euryarchaeota archaeon]|nr:FmdE family protein [Euryarchaeota archaeon]
MKTIAVLGLMFMLLCSGFTGIAAADDSIDITGAVQGAMIALGATNETPGLCVLTDAGYVKVNGETTQGCIATLRTETGCSVGDGNLLTIHRAVNKPLWFVIFDNATKDCVYTIYEDGAFNATTVNIDGENATTGDGWNAMKDALGADAFTIVTIANACGYGAPYDFLKCVEFHNHFCPGVTSGYMLADYLLEEYPLGAGEKYVVIACPVWCKDDALQVMLDTTVGKRGIFVKNMPEHDNIENAAGIYIIWNGTLGSGTGHVLSFDFDRARNVSNVTESDFETYPMASRIKMDWGMMPYLDQPETFISTIYTFNVTSDLLKRLELAGVDPYVEIGLADDPCGIDISGALQDAMATLGVSRGSSSLCVLTDAGYAIVDGNTTECCIGTIERDTGCSISDGNLLPIHRSVDKPLWFAIFDNETKDCVYAVYKNGAFATTEVNIAEENVTTGDGWNATKKALGSDAFTIAGVANSWGYGAPNDLLKCAELHNHICPGLSSGYLIAGYIRENYPLGTGESYTWVGCPNWCKEDAIQVLLDLTPGKGSMIVKQRSGELFVKEKPLAGILIVWNSTAESGRGVAFQYDWGTACNLSGINSGDFKPPGGKVNPLFWTTRIKGSLGLLPYLNQPEMFVSPISDEFNVTSEQLDRVKMAGVDPYVELGLAEPTEVRGDFNGDGEVTSADALLLLQVAAGKVIL